MKCPTFQLHILLIFYVNNCLAAILYTCVSENNCVKAYSHTHQGNESTLFDTLNHCRLLCGQYGPLWPKPTGSVMLDKKTVAINPWSIRFEINGVNQSSEALIMLEETERYFLKNIHREDDNLCAGNGVLLVKVTVSTDETELNWSTDESYILKISSTGSDTVVATVQAGTIFGARHAVETLSQLMVVLANDRAHPTCAALHTLTGASIHDKPAYPHRGLLIDTARNYIPVNVLKRQLDAMAACKMNILHWHVTDTQSFPIVLDGVPEASLYGAYSETAVYTQIDVQGLISYAKNRGIRIIFEFDAPAHAGNGWQWGPSHGLGDLALCVNQQPWRSSCIEPPCGQLNPVNPNLYDVLQKLYLNFAALNGAEEVFHMGGDEVFFGCWNASEEVVHYLRDRGMGQSDADFLQLWSEFQNKSLQLWDNARIRVNRDFQDKVDAAPVILWSSHLTDPSVIDRFLTNRRYIIQTWVPADSQIPQALQTLGYKLIVSTKDAWYLDHGFWGQTTYYSWQKVYNNQLPRGPGVLGGEVCVWTEFIDEHSLEGRTWPRAAAAAERLWTNPTSAARDAEPRFFRQRNRLISRGLNPEAVAPKWCEQNESECH